MHCKGDAMAYDSDSSDSLLKLKHNARARQHHASMHLTYESIIPKIEMLVGAWYVDEYGNQTREVKARD
jgi:hypothetical protein